MCGILGIFGIKGEYHEVRALAVALSHRMKHRGPDDADIIVQKDKNGAYNILCHQRLSILDTSPDGRQPKYGSNKKFMYAINGEIFNYEQIKQKFGKNYHFDGTSDSEAVGVLYQEYGKQEFCNHFEGMFGIIIYDMENNTFLAARDHIGIIPMYVGKSSSGAVFVSSELKVIHDECVEVDILKPGCLIDNSGVQQQWYQPKWHNMDYIPDRQISLDEIRERLTQSVKDQLMGDVPFGLLISGGVDSSLIAAIACRLIRSGEVDIKKHGMTDIPSFCVGLEGSPDLAAARKVADYLGTNHHEIIFTVEQGLDAIPEVVYHVETFNQTTIRASTPMYLMARYIKAQGIKVVLTGEGADEIFGGYLYFHKAPNREELHKETIRKCRDLYKYDLARANKSTMAWGIELRPPFMQKSFVEAMMDFDPSQKMPRNNEKNIEKYILRKAFDDEVNPYIPKEVLWRQKEQFSDGVGYKWMNGIQNLASQYCSDEMFQNAHLQFPLMTPTAKEMYMLRTFFQNRFPGDSCAKTVPFQKSIACSTEAALEWDESFKKNTDESGRAVLGVHDDSMRINKSAMDIQKEELVEKN